MSYTFHTDITSEEMDSFVISSSQNSLFQCSNWAKVKNNWDHLFTCVKEDGRIVGTAMVLIRRMPLGKTLFYIPRGPVMDYSNVELVRFYFDKLKETARKRKAIAIRFDPAVLSRRYSYRDRDNLPARENEDVISFLKLSGAQHKGYTTMIEEATQPRFNAEMDVETDYIDHLEHKTMKCVRAAERRGIEVTEGLDQVHDFAVAMHYTEVRKQIALRNESYFKDMLEVYGDKGICMVARLNFRKQMELIESRMKEMEDELTQEKISKKRRAELNRLLEQDQKEYNQLNADHEREGKDEVITCGILACYNDSLMELFYMGNNPDYLRLYSSYLLYKLCLDRCVELGIKHCSFGGIEGTLDDGLTLFKSNWLMNVEEYIGEFNYVLDSVTYTAFDKVYPALLKTAAKLRGRQ